MFGAARALDFEEGAYYRSEMLEVERERAYSRSHSPRAGLTGSYGLGTLE